MSTTENSPLELIASGIEAETADGAAAAPGATGEADQAAPAQEPPAMSNAEIIAGAIYAGRDVFCLYTQLRSPAKTLDDQAIGVLAQRWAAVCDKRGVDLSKYFKDYTLELAAVIATVGVARAVYAGVQAELAVLNAKTRTVPDAPHGDSTDPARPE